MRSNPNTGKIDLQSWADFRGPYRLKTDNTPIQRKYNLPLHIQSDDQIDWDKLAKQHAAAFQQGEVTRERLASILELRSIMEICPRMTIESLDKLDQNEKLHFLFMSPTTIVDKSLWQKNVTDKLSEEENFFTEVNIPIETMNDSRLFNLFMLAHQLKIIYIKDFETVEKHRFVYNSGIKTLTFHMPSVSARDALTKYAYGETVKPLVARVGELSVDDIERSVRNRMRYAVFSYPGVRDTTEFHGINAPIFYMSLHDEVHRRLMSYIPDKVLDAYFAAIDLVRETTGIFWSDDIWNAIDLEVGDLLAFATVYRDSSEPQHITAAFEKLIAANKYSNFECMGLFTKADACLDTIFILLLDIVFNKDKWMKLGIERQYFTDPIYVAYFELIERRYLTLFNMHINSMNRADQVAYLKSEWVAHKGSAGLAPVTEPTTTGHKFKKVDGYLQVTKRNKIIATESKARFIAMDYFKSHVNILSSIISQQKKGIKDAKILALVAQAENVSYMLNGLVTSPKLKFSIPTIKQYTDIIETTGYLVTDPSNKFLQKKYSDIICSRLSLPKKVWSAIKAFFSTLLELAINAEHRNNKMELIGSKYRLFKEEYTPIQFKEAIDFKNQATQAPASYNHKRGG